MNVPNSLIRYSFCALLTCPAFTHAIDVTVRDACGHVVTGTVASGSDAVTVNSSGNVEVQGFGSSYWAGFGECDPAAADGKPRCTLSASRTMVNKGETVTLFAKCSSTPQKFSWNRPIVAPLETDDDSLTVTLSKAGSHTYTVAAKTTSAAPLGPPSTPVTILVSDPAVANEVPTCLLTLSPVFVVAGTNDDAKATASVVCHPPASSYVWDAAETGAPAVTAGAAGALLTFGSPGTFTYKVVGKTSTGVSGPKASAAVTVAPGALGCTPGPFTYESTAPAPGTYGPDITYYGTTVWTQSFPGPAGITKFVLYSHSQYTTYYTPTMTWAISKCKGDFNVAASCTWTGMGFGTYLMGRPAGGAGYCTIEQGPTYYLNMKVYNCNPGPAGCGFRVFRMN